MLKDYSFQLGKKLIIENNDVLIQISLEDISHILSNGSNTVIIMNNWQKYYCKKELDHFKELLKDYKFIKINNQTLINKLNILRIKNSINNTIIMRNQEIFHFDSKNELDLMIAS